MPTARITQGIVEVLVRFPSHGRVTQSTVEVLERTPSVARTTQELIEVLERVTTTTSTTTSTTVTGPPLRITHALAEVIRSGDPKLRVTHGLVEVLRGGDPKLRITHSLVEVLRDSGFTTTTSTTTTTTGIGTVCWGHDTSVEEVNIRNLVQDWEGSAGIAGSGDGEYLEFQEGESEQLKTPWRIDGEVKLRINKYQSGDNVSIFYRTGSSIGATIAKAWEKYTVNHFTSQGYVDVRLLRGSTTTTSSTTTSTTTTSTTTTTISTTTTTTAPPEYFSMESEAHLILSDDSSLVI